MGLNTKDINSIEDMQNFVEGCINDYDDNFCTKEELLCDLRDYKQFNEGDRENLIDQAKELSEKGLSQRKIASELNISVGAVNKYLKI
jgi:Trp operon repressor